MNVIGIDTETHRIRPGNIAPQMVCLTVAQDMTEQLFDREKGLLFFEQLLSDPEIIMTGHHIFYDLAVILAQRPDLTPQVFEAMHEGRLRDTKIRDMILLNALGQMKFNVNELGEVKPTKFSLGDAVWRHFGTELAGKTRDKNCTTPNDQSTCACGSWRLHFGELDGVPIEEWPKEAREYAMGDATWAWRVFHKQREICEPEGMPGEISRTLAAWALHLMSVWGVRADPTYVAAFEKEVMEEFNARIKACQKAGLVRTGKKASKNLAAIRERIAAAYGGNPPTTPKGAVSTSRDTLMEAVKYDPALEQVAELGKVSKLKGTYLPILKRGVRHPVNASYNPILETFRTSCRTPNMQNPPRKGGFRECFVPREGWVYVFCDYSSIEMRTLAQVCYDLFGYSALGEALKKGLDPHLMMAAEMLEIDYDEALRRYKAGDQEVADMRQASKPANFGFPGGMGPDAFVEYAWTGYGVRVTLEMAQHLHGLFRRVWHEMEDYFRYCSDLVGPEGYAKFVEFVRTGYVRGRVRYTAICNGFFQHLAAIGATSALAEVSEECYVEGRESPLYGSRPVYFLHDEIGIEVPAEELGPVATSAAADQLSKVMIDEMQRWVPDLPVLADPAMMRRWYKGAEPVRNDQGLLIPSKPRVIKLDDGNKRVVWEADV